MLFRPFSKAFKVLPAHVFLGLVLFSGPIHAQQSVPFQVQEPSPLSDLGQLMFFDTTLSMDGTQSCATCHDPAFGFADPRDNTVNKMASLGDDGISIGDRNAPTASYAAFAPPFHQTKDGTFRGGAFWDGRAADLAAQAGGPPLNLAEMGFASKAAFVARLRENPYYEEQFIALFGEDVFSDIDQAYVHFTQAVAAFEQTAEFAPFDSKYDRYLRGEIELAPEEELGRVLFFSQQFTNCAACHQLNTLPGAQQETFTNYEFHNIGLPVNTALRAANGVTATDEGLFANPLVTDPAHRGKFKVPTLRNVAVTGPYMHNGLFQDLETTVRFYNKYNSRAASAQINPETGQAWGAPEVPDTLSLEELEQGDALDERRIKALVAFMKTLTDQRYEHLLTE